MKTQSNMWVGIGILILLSPLGLVLPEYFKAGDAWGEWGTDSLHEMVGYIPQGLEKLSSLWNAPIPDYAFKGWEEKGITFLSGAYIFSALLGISIVVIIVMTLGKLVVKKGQP